MKMAGITCQQQVRTRKYWFVERSGGIIAQTRLSWFSVSMNKHDKSFNKSIEISAQKNCMIPVIPAEQKKYSCVKHFNKPLELRAFKLALYEWEVICYFSLNFN